MAWNQFVVAKNNIKKIATDFLRSDFGIALLIALAYQTLMTVLGFLGELSFSDNPNQTITLLSHTGHWDGGWYQFIINGGYFKSDAAPAFFPLFPLAVICFRMITFGFVDALTAGFIINLLATWAAIVALVKIADYFVGKNYRWWVVALFITSPAAIFLHMFYTEALFCAIGFFAYLFALRRRWLLVGILLGILTAARNPAVLFIGLCGLEYLRSYDWRIKKAINPNILWVMLAPIGLIAYAIFLYFAKGNPTAMLSAIHATNDWVYHVFNPNFILTIAHQISAFVKIIFLVIPFDKRQIIDVILPLIGLFILGFTSMYDIRNKRNDKLLPLGIFGLVSIIFFTLNSNIVSVHRYLLPILTIYIATAYYLERHKNNKLLLFVIIFCNVSIQLYLLMLFASLKFAG